MMRPLLLLLPLLATACSQAAPTTTTISLYNGADLTGWHVDIPDADENPVIAASFVVEDGMLMSLGSPNGHLITDASYSNYRLEIEYRWTGEVGNCGVLVHASTPRRLYGMFPQSIEVQMHAGNAGDFWCIGEDITVPDMVARRGPEENWGVDGSKARRIRNLTDDSENPPGEWNTMAIECRGSSITVWVNGELVNRGSDCTATEGSIALQAEGAAVAVRRFELTPLALWGSESTPVRLRFENGVRDVLEDRNGNLWFASHNEGVARFDGEQYTYYTVDDGLSHNQVRSLRMSPDGTVWFEGGSGLSSYDGEKISVRAVKDYSAPDDWQISASDIWFKGDEEYGFSELESGPGAYRWDGSTLKFLAFPPLPNEDEEDSRFYYSVTDIAQGKDGRVWFATYGAVIGFDGKSFTIITNQSLGLSEGTGFLHVRSVHEDRNGKLWIGNNGIGVLLYDGETTINFTDKFKLGKAETAGAQPSLHRVFSIAEDATGNLWFGTAGSGAWRYDGESLTHFGPEDGLPIGQVWAIHENQRGELFFTGADPSGVFKFNGTTFEQVY